MERSRYLQYLHEKKGYLLLKFCYLGVDNNVLELTHNICELIMTKVVFPSIDRLVESSSGNAIWHSYQPTTILGANFELRTTDPFIVKEGGNLYFFTSDEKAVIPDQCSHALLTTKKPKKKEFLTGKIIFKRWLKHPSFDASTPETVLASWKGKFQFVKEDEEYNVEGMRPPQLGALYAILSHSENAEERALIVMPTGTGKTEVMLCALIANNCNKLLVAVPSDSLRTQLSNKFNTLGLLRRFKIIDDTCLNPIVGVMNSKFTALDDLKSFISKSNVVVTTMSILTGYSDEFKAVIASQFSHLFVDEAHHSEATTWKYFIDKFDPPKVFLFTATPFRTDERRLNGKTIFNFSLRNAQAQRYYKEINYLPIREYDPQKADERIAEQAISQLRKDHIAGYKHIIMARCRDKKRAEEVVKYYQKHGDLKTVVVYTGVTGLSGKINGIKNKEYNIVVCVDMLGEGFDLPELKIAAIHDERQSIPITLQFVGRFTRSSYEKLGNASFIANVAYPPIKSELEKLYAKDSDWNLLLPAMSEASTDKELNFKEFLDGFSHLEDSAIPFQSIYPAMSTVVYLNEGDEWSPQKWRDGIRDIDTYAHQYSNHNPHNNTLVIILGRISDVDWGRFDTVQNVIWDMIVVHWDLRPEVNRIFVNSSDSDFKEEKLVHAIFGKRNSKIKGMDVFRIFDEVNRLAVQNFGGRKGIGKDITFQSFFGKGVQDGLNLLEKGTLIKNNVFGIGYREGEKVTLGCSVSGKMWSYLRGNLNDLTAWFRSVGDIVTNESINPNTVLEHTLFPITIIERPNIIPISVEWHHDMLMHPEHRYKLLVNGQSYDLSNSELNIVDGDVNTPLRFSLDTEENHVEFELLLGENTINEARQAYHAVKKISSSPVFISYGKTVNQPLEEFFQIYTPIIWFADGSQLFQNRYVRLREKVGYIPSGNIITDSWDGVSIQNESQGIAPYIRDSIQYYFISKIINDFGIVYDDDGKGEIADIIGINNFDRYIEVNLFHLKYAQDGKRGNNIDNFYQVCGQAQKSLNWKYRQGKDFFDHLLRRIIKSENGEECSRLIKGTSDELELLLNSAKWDKEMRFKIFIVQPSLRKEKASNDILLLLGNTYHYLHTVGNIELKVYTS